MHSEFSGKQGNEMGVLFSLVSAQADAAIRKVRATGKGGAGGSSSARVSHIVKGIRCQRSDTARPPAQGPALRQLRGRGMESVRRRLG